MLGLVWALYASFGLITTTIPPLVGPIVDDLGLTYSQMGLILGAWQLVYIAAAFPLGTLIDRLGVRRSLAIGIVVVWISLILRGAAVDFWTLFLSVALFGLGGPIISIGAPKVVALWFGQNERGIAAGVYATGPVIGMAAALATASSLVMPLVGTWRGISLVYGAIVLLVVVAWWLLARDTPSPSPQPEKGSVPTVPGRTTQPSLIRMRNVQVLLVMATATFLLNHGLNNWGPTLLRESGMTLSQSGVWMAVGTAIGAIGLLVFPVLARYGYRAMMMGLLLAAAAVSTAGLGLLHGPMLVAALVVSSMARMSMMPILILILMETPGVGPARMGSAGGLFFAAAEIGGFGGSFLLGVLRDATGSLTSGAMTLAAVSAALILAVPLLQERRKPQPLDQGIKSS